MRSEPDPNADPYRALGLEPGASVAEIKRAYRLLAKAFHPDSAGEAALPRFLAIHAAYEQLKTGRAPTNPRAARAAPPPPAEPWRADPARARAARERARTARPRSRAGPASAGPASGRTGTTGGPGSTASGRPSGPSGSSGQSGSAGSTKDAGASTGRGRATGTRGAGRRHERKATMGSTSYDEARDPSDATWSGASWYGPSSGEYWIVNPREYADPRKHGPEYQQRARRPAGDEAAEAIGGSDATWAAAQSFRAAAGAAPRPAAGAAPGRAASPNGGPAASPTGGPAASPTGESGRPGRSATGSTEATRPGSAWAARANGPASGAGARWDRLGDVVPDDLPNQDAGTQASSWLRGPADDPTRRLGLALVAWPPIGLAAAAVIGDVTGCSLYAAECTGSEPLLPWLAQAAILGLLLLLPPVARLLAGGAVAVLLALVPITAFLVAVGGTGAPQAVATLAVLLGVAWLLGIGWSAATLRQRAARAGP
ncbi:MAG TPA: J domain-containing protein [Candidatus Limnocylindria bacterium]|nr:J domain-containing protein [Candidatus Limnocylindria bacterium]